jgi:hypothetical protein
VGAAALLTAAALAAALAAAPFSGQPAAAAPTGASPPAAAPFGELPYRPVAQTVTCLRATGTPGELTRWVPGGAELMRATRDGLASGARIALGTPATCPVLATQPGGAGIAATLVRRGARTYAVRVACAIRAARSARR